MYRNVGTNSSSCKRVDQHDVPVEKTHSLLKVLDVMENPFVSIDSAWKQSKYLMRNGYYVEP